MPDLSLVIPAWLTSQRIAEVAEQTLPAYRDSGIDCELIVVDNGSTFGHSLLAEHADVYIPFTENQGYPGGVNAGLEVAAAPVAGIGSIDILMPADWGQPFLDAAPKVASAVETGLELKRAKDRGDWWGAMFTFPRSVLDTVGYMDGDTFNALSDRDFGIRLAIAGYEFCRVDVPVGHLFANHAHKFAHRNVVGYKRAFRDEARALESKYGVTTWLAWVSR